MPQPRVFLAHTFAACLLVLGCSTEPAWPPRECTRPAPVCSDAASCGSLIDSLKGALPGANAGVCWRKVVGDLATHGDRNQAALEILCDDRQGPGDYLVGCAALGEQGRRAGAPAHSNNWRVLANMLAIGNGSSPDLRARVGAAMGRDTSGVLQSLKECDRHRRTWQAAYLLPDVVQNLPIPAGRTGDSVETWAENRSVARALGFAGDPRSEATLLQLAADPSSFSTRVAAVIALGRLSQLSQAGKRALESASSDPVDRVRHAAKVASKAAGGDGYRRIRTLVDGLSKDRGRSPERPSPEKAPAGTLAAVAEQLDDEESILSSACTVRLYHPPSGDWVRTPCGGKLTTHVAQGVDLVEVSTFQGHHVRIEGRSFEVPGGPRSAQSTSSDGILVRSESGDLTLFGKTPARLVWSRCLHDDVGGATD